MESLQFCPLWRREGRSVSLVPCICVFGILPCTLIPHIYSPPYVSNNFHFLFFHFLPLLLFIIFTFLSSVISRPAIERYILPPCYALSLICENGERRVKIY